VTSLFELPLGNWSTERTLVLSARCRGSLLTGWADNADRRAGSGTADGLRAWLGALGIELPLEPVKDAWYPAAAQLLLTERVLADYFASDTEALVHALTEDAVRQTSKAAQLALKLGGFSTMLRFAPRVHPEAYDAGRLSAEVGRRSAKLSYAGSVAFGNPTWAFLQGAALIVLGNATSRRVTVDVDLGDASAVLTAAWA
jgi:hypothetical protein